MRHHLLFYEDDATLIDRVAAFARDGLAADEVVIIVATADHRAAIDGQLAASGFDPAAAKASGRLQSLEAAELLAQFADGAELDIRRFDNAVGELIRAAVASGRPVRAFGEMVALLWDAGHTAAAIELEDYWEALGTSQAFELLCAYPSEVLAGTEDCDRLNRVCQLHSEVALGAKDAAPTQLRAYPAQLGAIPAARRFVAECVGDGATRAAFEDALLVASELSANAVYHARTPFVLELSWHDDVIRIGVRDAFQGRPQMRTMNVHSGSGRGIAMVDTLCARWGVEPHSRGKTVWAEVPI